MKTTDLFSGKAEVYEKSRPSYPVDLLDYLFERLSLVPGAQAADMGAGTGIFTRLLLERGLQVIVVEPNDDMRARAMMNLRKYPGFSAVKGIAEDSSLPEGGMDLVTAAQAFHWFDALRFSAECRRILKRNGHAVLVWNNRDSSSPLVKENAEICRRFCPAFKGFSGGMEEKTESLDLFFGKNGYEVRLFSNDLIFDREGFISRNMSSSYAPLEGTGEYGEFAKALNGLFDKYKTGDTVLMPNVTRSYLGQF